MASEEDGPFGIDDDEDDIEYVVVDPNDSGRQHDKWTLITGLLDLAANVAADVSDFFTLQAKASSQHGWRKIQLREMHEVVARELETLPLTTDDEEDDDA